MRVEVECEPGHQGEATPHRLAFDHRTVAVVEVIDRWLAREHRYFKVKGEDGALYILRHDVPADRWQLILFERERAGERARQRE
jgi:hypothetical protein